MLKKEIIIKNFDEENVKDAIKIYEKYKLAYEKGITTFVNGFYAPSIWDFFLKNSNNNIKVGVNGFFDEAERRMISFNNYAEKEYPINVLKIINKSNFSNLKHKDYLGSVLSLGIERNKIGDIMVRGNSAYLPVVNEIAEYIIDNLSFIGKSPVSISEINDVTKVPSPEFEEILIAIPSLRLDSVVSKLANISRSKSIELIDSGKVLIDYTKSRDKSKEVLEGSRVTIRGLGKFIIGQVVGETKSGKEKIVVKKYV